MDVWAQDVVDLVVPGYIEIEPGLQGSFQFATVSGDIDGRIRRIGETLFLEWSWWGETDADDGCGRGWAQLDGEKLTGRIFIHGSDDSAFTAQRMAKRSRAAVRESRVPGASAN